MKTEFKAKFLQTILKKKKEEGFTLIELLVVIIIIGILSAIALPSFLSQANKGKQAEAKQNIATINKAQQAYAVENSGWVTDIGNIGALGTGIKTASVNYTYSLFAISTKEGAGVATSGVGTGLLAYAGGVANVYQSGGTLPSALSIICQSTKTSVTGSSTAITHTLGDSSTAGSIGCGTNFTEMVK